MNRTLKLALGLVLSLGLVGSAFAQNFPDIPDNHWAYEAIANLKGKVLFGYPDGLYRPARPMSRAEFAAAINQLYQLMMAKDNQLQTAIDELNRKIANMPTGGTGNGPTRQEFDALKRQVDELSNRVNGMASWGQDINNLKRLSSEFERELADMGVNMDAMKRDMSDLAARVTKLEAGGGSMPVNIHGSGDFVVVAGHSTDNMFGLTPGGRLTGYAHDDFIGPVDHAGMNRDLSVFHEMNLTLDGNGGEGVTWVASINAGNAFGWHDGTGFGNYDWDFTTSPSHFQEEETDIYFDQFNVNFNTSIAGQGFNAQVGRFRHDGGMFFLQRQDTTEFLANSRWDNGEYVMDGGKLDFKFGSVDLTAFATRNSSLTSVNGVMINPMEHDLGSNSFTVDQMLGVELNIALGEKGSIKGVHYWMDSNVPDSGINRMNTFGGQLNYNLGAVDLYASYAQTDFSYNTNTVLNTDNAAWAAWIAHNSKKWGFDGGFARVEGNFGAFGNWGRLGTAWNPSNIEGFGAGLWFQLTERVKLSGGAAMFKGAEDTSGLFGLPITTDDNINSYHLGLDYGLNSAWNMKLGFENVMWDYDAGTDPNQKWYTLGLDYHMNDRSSVSIIYMMSDVDFKGRAALDANGFNRYKGGVLGTQVSFKF